MTASKNTGGFSLFELLMVMLLMSIVAGIVIPLIQPQKFQMDAAVVVVASTFTAQQRGSILRQHDMVVAVDSANSWLRAHRDADNDGAIDAGENFNVIQLDDGVVFGRGAATARPLGGAMNTFTDSQDGMPALTFRRNGSASSESILYLTSARAAVSGAFPNDTRAVEIERATGRVRCYSFQPGSWIQTC